MTQGTTKTIEQAFSQRLLEFFQETEERKQQYQNHIRAFIDEETAIPIDYSELVLFSADLAQIYFVEAHYFDKYVSQTLAQFAQECCPDDIKNDFIAQNHSASDIDYSIKGFTSRTSLRDLGANDIGHLTKIHGQVTRATEIRPELVEGSFICKQCAMMQPKVEQQFRYTVPIQCANQTCNNRKNWELVVGESTFVDWQKIKIQESPDEIPIGSLPRRLDVVLRRSLCDKAKPGDHCVFTGILVAVPDVSVLKLPGQTTRTTGAQTRIGGGVGASRGDAQGFVAPGIQGLKETGGRDLSYGMCFIALDVENGTSRSSEELFQEVEREENGEIITELEYKPGVKERLDQIKARLRRGGKDVFDILAESVAPSIWGHLEVKKGILLALVGGVPKPGTNIEGEANPPLRGDINVCIVGDPATAKSQLLRSAAGIAPRSVLATGQSSSAAGLTAAVVKDSETGDFTVEAGAMILGDNGVVCIDEFEKMDQNDQVAIHEAMEQQTITIAKAGIHATFNARCSVIAAANPKEGVYNSSKPLRDNIDLSAAIMSRFDLFYVILDEPDSQLDRKLADYVISVRQNPEAKYDELVMNSQILPREDLIFYINASKHWKPQWTDNAALALKQAYLQAREEDSNVNSNHGSSSYRITVRQLESMIRMSEALAKINLASEIHERYVWTAYRLMMQSVSSLKREQEQVLIEEPIEFDVEPNAVEQIIIQQEQDLLDAAPHSIPSMDSQLPPSSSSMLSLPPDSHHVDSLPGTLPLPPSSSQASGSQMMSSQIPSSQAPPSLLPSQLESEDGLRKEKRAAMERDDSEPKKTSQLKGKKMLKITSKDFAAVRKVIVTTANQRREEAISKAWLIGTVATALMKVEETGSLGYLQERPSLPVQVLKVRLVLNKMITDHDAFREVNDEKDETEDIERVPGLNDKDFTETLRFRPEYSQNIRSNHRFEINHEIIMTTRAITLTPFSMRHFGTGNTQKKVQMPCTPDEFLDAVNSEYEGEKIVDGKNLKGKDCLVDGYAPFCKHIFIKNIWNIEKNIVEITPEIEPLIRSGYIRRTPAELPVLCRWLPRAAASSLLKPSIYIDVILYSAEQCKDEGESIGDSLWGVVGLIPCDTETEYPMAPITAMRNALGISEGGSGVPIDRDAYEKSASFWDKHINVEDGE
ncbi:putative DNA replication licensing factor mcm6 [Blattamonas nauphoetae]|uniref:DNA replication licensing factor MCM6 n=1 Tax=Blattamonas nauphoetae TaxID=2049346 RepID=A0ABQ9XCL5_9EUKA|nr:putative DNA replication licensing factor mcm6 [Blattamonas nauphoetae]